MVDDDVLSDAHHDSPPTADTLPIFWSLDTPPKFCKMHTNVSLVAVSVFCVICAGAVAYGATAIIIHASPSPLFTEDIQQFLKREQVFAGLFGYTHTILLLVQAAACLYLSCFYWKVHQDAHVWRKFCIVMRIGSMLGLLLSTLNSIPLIGMQTTACESDLFGRTQQPEIAAAQEICSKTFAPSIVLVVCSFSGAFVATYFMITGHKGFFLTKTIMACLRWYLGCICIALAIHYNFFRRLRRVEEPDFNAPIRYQFFILTNVQIVAGFIVGVPTCLGAYLSMHCCWTRSKFMLMVDGLMLFIIFWFQGSGAVSLNWVLQLTKFFCNIDTHTNFPATPVTVSTCGQRTFSIIYYSFQFCLVALSIVDWILVFLAYTFYTPLEWKILDKTKARKEA